MPYVPPHIERLVPYVPGKPIEELERELGIRDAIKLASNENPTGPSPLVLDAVARASKEIHRYPDAAGFALKSDLAAFHKVSAAEIALGNGSNELIDLLCRTFADAEHHAVIGTPSFVCYRLGLISANVPFTEVPLREDFAWSADDLLAAVRPNTRLLFVANPNNPTGTHMNERELRALLRGAPRECVVVLDEAYVQFADAPDYRTALDLRDLHPNLVVLRTFSKAYGMAGLRVGYSVASPVVTAYLDRVRAPFNVSLVGQYAARVALTDAAYVERYVELNRVERDRVRAGLMAGGYRVAPSQANFVFVEVSGQGSETAGGFYDRLLRQGVIVRPMPTPSGQWVRITIGTEAENNRLLTVASKGQ